MKNFEMFVFVIAALMAPAISEAQEPATDEVVADRLHCEPGEIQVCTEPTEDGGFSILYRRGSPMFDCSVASDRGVDLRCVAQVDACDRRLCDRRDGNWRWNERECRCDYERRVAPPPTPPTSPTPVPPAPPIRPGPGGGTTTIITSPQCTAGYLQQILDGLNAIQERIGQLEVLAVEEIREMRAEAENLREQANECRDEVLAERATVMAATLEPEAIAGHDYHDEFARVHQHLDNLDFTVEANENFCTDSFGGVLVCIVLPTVAAGAAIFLGVYYGTEWSATQD